MADVRDFYIKWIGHPKYNENEIIIEEEIQLIINKIEMVLFTNKGEFIGDVDFGCDLPKYLWDTYVSAEFIKGVIQTQYNKYIPELTNYRSTLEVYIQEGTLQDILVVNTTINNFKLNATFS